MKKKGFTLIELLAVIVILAIIAIIAVPTISNVVKKARKGAAEASALNYIDAVEKYVILHDMNPDKYPYDIKGGTFNVASNTELSLLDLVIPKAKAEDVIPSLNSFINVKGDKPKSGTITTNEKGKVTEADIVIKGYSVECTGSSCDASDKVDTISIDGEDNDEVGRTETITLTVTSNSDKEVVWTSSDNSIATVNNGVVTGIKIGQVTITAKVGKASDAVTINVVKNGPTKVAAKSGDTHKGIIYIDPTDLTKTCNATLASRNIDTTTHLPTGIKEGCMKWYVYKETDNKYYMILDHNTTPNIVWSLSNNGNISYANSLVKPQLESDTANWNNTLNARLINKTEIDDLIDGHNVSGTYRLDGTGDNHNVRPEYTASIRSVYSWLYDYTNECKTGSKDNGCVVEDNNEYNNITDGTSNILLGYWTSQNVSFNSSSIWVIDSIGYMNYYTKKDKRIGIRPVIEVDKNIFN